MIQSVNALIQGWVNYFGIGNSNSAFKKVGNFIEKKVRKFRMKRQKRKGYGRKKWNREDIHQRCGLYNDYPIRYFQPKAAPSR